MSKMISPVWAVLLLGLLAVCGPDPAAGAGWIPSPPFRGTALPVPPHQHDPWTAPGGLLPALTSAAASLFDQGLADPRGGEYRVIAVGVGSIWSSDGGVVETHGWVLPAAGPGPRFGVCWNGLVYPLASVGGPADLTADVATLVQVDQAARKAHRGLNPDFPLTRFGNEPPEGLSVSEKSLLPVKACLLLRAGRADLARAFWDEWVAAARSSRVNDNNAPWNNPYLMLASDWAWALYDRALTAHMRGDDRLSLLSARQLTAIEPLIEAEAERRGFPKQFSPDAAGRDQPQPYLRFWDHPTLPALLADEQRRVAEPKRVPALTAGLNTFPTKAARIAALIRDLDLVSGREWDQPGADFGADPVVVALIAQGDDAVPPLLDALVHDDRLTRSWLSVPEAARAALSGILETYAFSVQSHADDLTQHPTAERQRVADAIRAFWLKSRGLSRPERWYRTLSDDTVGKAEWLQAAESILLPDNVRFVPGRSQPLESVTTPLPPGQTPGCQGEALRAKTDPSVSDLMVRHVRDIAPLPGVPATAGAIAQMRDATRMALLLAAWDARAALPLLRAQMQRSQAFDNARFGRSWFSLFGSDYVSITQARLRGGDPAAQADFGAWLRSTLPMASNPEAGISVSLLAPLWQHPDDPEAERTADALFDAPGSPFNPLPATNHTFDPQLDNVIASPLLGLTAFRRQVLRELADAAPAGTLTVWPRGGGADLKYPSSVTRGFAADTRESATGPGTAQTLRRCDLYAWALATVEGMAGFNPLWPEDKKAAAKGQDIALLRRFGPRFAYTPAFDSRWGREEDYRPRPHLTFPALTRPATDADVRAGQALFALTGTRRVWKLPAFPLKARWLTLRDDPFEQQKIDPATGKSTVVITYHQDGWVWQAEEQQVGGRWVRFYGFVGPHEVARVPANEIEFPATDPAAYQWLPLTESVDARLNGLGPPLGPAGIAARAAPAPRVGSPLPLTLEMRNRSGVAQHLPAGLARTAVLHLFYAAPNPANPFDNPSDQDWQELPPKAGASFPSVAAARTLEPAEAAAVATVDLNALFGCSSPGFYRAELVFPAVSDPATGRIAAIPFRLAPRPAPSPLRRTGGVPSTATGSRRDAPFL